MSPNKTLYIRDDDMSIWERAEKAAAHTKLSISQFVTQALRELVVRVNHAVEDAEDITVMVGREDHSTRWETVFRGTWIIEPDDDNRWSEVDAGSAYGVARTARNALAFYHYHVNDLFAPALVAYTDLDTAVADLHLTDEAAAIIASALGQRRVVRQDI